MKQEQKHYGKYRGTVLNNIDPEQRGRIQAIVPAVSGYSPTSWAMPCVPIAGKQEGIFAVPQIGAGVWIEFEGGDSDKPIWVGGFWGLMAEVPALALTPPPIPPGQNIVVQTTGQNALVLSDSAPTPVSGGLILKSTTGAMIVVNDSGIYISNGKGATITLLGPVVDINNGALTII
ncbi:MAG TPA: phage baseplate assembly protein V [Candidatus Thiothrix moscowensis]|uniref:phage baseplate assembly protein V n=1 Tax=Thiothrix sp. UBA2016 TaxID=1947695 RepID=UPI0025D5F645|nr:phage baseplate assembly protein V [Thiothrix sp. UBA2016]HRJ53120.1 phage baseplate assembly protein V [Candidatus Thiothrix moscowensis]HRJ93111.1 phage baseplate assembly protein V [Candidatus Thiothrix moscowensis]